MHCKTTAAPRSIQSGIAILAAALGVVGSPRRAEAQLRLRGDALAEAQSPAGLVVLQGQDKVRPWLETEGLVWAGAGAQPHGAADVLVLSVRLRDPSGHGEIRGGRFILATGAIRPVQMDGASILARSLWGPTVEAFGGAPVVPRFAARPYDWLAGGRISQSIVSKATLGVSYVQRRTDGEIANHEVGADLAAVPTRWLDLAAMGSYDLTSLGLADARVSAASRFKDVRLELFASQRSPSRLLPATSLFSVLGDFPSQMIGGTVKWKAAPRLDLLFTGAAQSVGGEGGGNSTLRALLRLDDRGDGSLGLELRRQDVSTARWTGVRMIGAQRLGAALRFSSELELVVPDQRNGGAGVWPWLLVALGWRSGSGWGVAGAIEASSTPEFRYKTDALLRVSRVLEIGR
jgi:hypothetical protein